MPGGSAESNPSRARNLQGVPGGGGGGGGGVHTWRVACTRGRHSSACVLEGAGKGPRRKGGCTTWPCVQRTDPSQELAPPMRGFYRVIALSLSRLSPSALRGCARVCTRRPRTLKVPAVAPQAHEQAAVREQDGHLVLVLCVDREAPPVHHIPTRQPANNHRVSGGPTRFLSLCRTNRGPTCPRVRPSVSVAKPPKARQVSTWLMAYGWRRTRSCRPGLPAPGPGRTRRQTPCRSGPGSWPAPRETGSAFVG